MDPIPTAYKGVKYRSQLEAQWAFLFDALEIRFAYEPEKFHIASDTSYVPDFWLPSQRIWIEVKPGPPTETETIKVVSLHRITRCQVFVFTGFPEVMQFSDDAVPGYTTEICNFGIFVVDDPTVIHVFRPQALSQTLLSALGFGVDTNAEGVFLQSKARLLSVVSGARNYFSLRPKTLDLAYLRKKSRREI